MDLFCGAGGFSLGVMEGGIDVVGAVENDPWAVCTYLTNLGFRRGVAVRYVEGDRDQRRLAKAFVRRKPGEIARSVKPGDPGWVGVNNRLEADMGCRALLFGDASRATGQMLLDALEAAGWRGEIDLVIGGPPCQGISRGSATSCPEDPRNNLLFEFLRLAAELGSPRWAMENVSPLVTEARFGPLWKQFVEYAHELGYATVTADVVDAVNYGVPQHRRRVLAQGTMAGHEPARLPMPSHWGFVSRDGEVTADFRPHSTTGAESLARKSESGQPDLFSSDGDDP